MTTARSSLPGYLSLTERAREYYLDMDIIKKAGIIALFLPLQHILDKIYSVKENIIYNVNILNLALDVIFALCFIVNFWLLNDVD
jgi:hypothetical protein